MNCGCALLLFAAAAGLRSVCGTFAARWYSALVLLSSIAIVLPGAVAPVWNCTPGDADSHFDTCRQLAAYNTPWLSLAGVIVMPHIATICFSPIWLTSVGSSLICTICLLFALHGQIPVSHFDFGLYPFLVINNIGVALTARTYGTTLRACWMNAEDAADKREIIFAERAKLVSTEASRAAHRSTLGYASHELRNPLHAATMALASITAGSDGDPLPAWMSADMAALRAALRQMSDVVHDMASYDGHITITSEAMSLGAVVAVRARGRRSVSCHISYVRRGLCAYMWV
jgi:signal transduction histidine kinase